MGLEVDAAFVQAAEHRPKPTISDAGEIPLIDLSPLLHHPIPSDPSNPSIPDEISSLVASIGAACLDWGFFQVVNHGVDLELLERIQAVAREFFALPAEEKRRVKRDEVNALGYYDTEHTKNVRDWKKVFDLVVREYESDDGSFRLRNQWPDHPPAMRCIQVCVGAMEEEDEVPAKGAVLGVPAASFNRPRLCFKAKQSSTTVLDYYYVREVKNIR